MSQPILKSAAIALALLSPAAALAANPPGYVTGVFAGQPDGAGILPNFNKVPGTTTQNLDIAVPQAVLTHGLSYTYTVASQNAGYSGTCKVSYSLTQIINNASVTLDAKKIATFNCAPGNTFAFYLIGSPVPNSPGPAILNGVVSFGTTKVSLKTPVFIQ